MLKEILRKIIGWYPLNPSYGPDEFWLKRQTKSRENIIAEEDNLRQICPVCKKLVSGTDLVCQYCNASLSSDYRECPFCKNMISEKDSVCPICGNLLIYEYPKEITARRNRVLFPLGFILISSLILVSFLQWRGIELNWLTGALLMIFWLIGLVFYGAYIGKGDKDFWWGK